MQEHSRLFLFLFVVVVSCCFFCCCLQSVVTSDILTTAWTGVDDILTAINTERDKTTAQPTPIVNSQTEQLFVINNLHVYPFFNF